MQGRWRDPLVGRDLLIGFACGTVIFASGSVLAANGVPTGLGDSELSLYVIGGPAHALSMPIESFSSALSSSCLLTFAVLVLRLVFRLQWLAIAIGSAMLTVFGMMAGG